MPAQLHLQTITAALGALMLAIIWSLRRCGLPGVREWYLANLTVTVALVLFALRGVVSDVLSIVVANAALAWALALFYAGTVRFCGGEPRWRALIGATLALTAGIVVWRYVVDVFNTRVVMVSAFHATLCALVGITLLRRRPAGGSSGEYLTTAAFALFFAVAHVARGVLSAFSVMDDPRTFASPTLTITFLTLGALVMPALTMGAVLMIHDAMVRKLQAIANTDALTGVLSRKAYEDDAERELVRTARGGGALALLIIDIDHFKAVNDTYGHAAGDAVLREFARTAGTALRPADRFGRLGGEEFAVLLPATPPAEALRVAERIRACAEANTVHGPFGIVRYTISAGMASWHPGEPLAQLTVRADAALYAAKMAGRNRIVAAGDPDDAPVTRIGARRVTDTAG